MTRRRSSKGLMLVEDPRDTIKTLCQLSDSVVDWEIYKKEYEKIKGCTNPISTQHADTHFYSLSIYGLIKPSESGTRGKYTISAAGRMLCQNLAKDRMNDYRRILSNLLLNNREKGHLFREFIGFVESQNKVTYDEICEFVEKGLIKEKSSRIGIISRTLIAWSEDSGLIETNKERKLVWSIRQEPTKQVLSLSQFWLALLEKYRYLKDSEIFGIEHRFIDILELRTLVCIDLSWSIENFDRHLVKLLDSEYGDKVRLYGAPTSMFSGRENFSYKGKLYVYIQIKV